MSNEDGVRKMDIFGIFAYAFQQTSFNDIGLFVVNAYETLNLPQPKADDLIDERDKLIKGEGMSLVVLCYSLMVLINEMMERAGDEEDDSEGVESSPDG